MLKVEKALVVVNINFLFFSASILLFEVCPTASISYAPCRQRCTVVHFDSLPYIYTDEIPYILHIFASRRTASVPQRAYIIMHGPCRQRCTLQSFILTLPCVDEIPSLINTSYTSRRTASVSQRAYHMLPVDNDVQSFILTLPYR